MSSGRPVCGLRSWALPCLALAAGCGGETAHARAPGTAPALEAVDRSPPRSFAQRWTPLLRTAADLVASTYRTGHPEFTVPVILVNNVGDGRKGVSLLVVADRAGRTADADSVSGICKTDGKTIRCAEGAVAALQSDADEDVPSPALLFVVAHELGHVFLGHPGSYVERTTTVDLSLPRREKAHALAKLCGLEDQVVAETQADAFAQDIVAKAFAAPPYLEAALGPSASVAFRAQRIIAGLQSVDDWSMRHAGGAPEPVIPLSRNLVCDLLRRTSDVVRIAEVHGTHPRGARRIATMTGRMIAAASALSPVPVATPDGPAGSLGGFSPLVSQTSAIFSNLDEQAMKEDDELSDQFCRTAQAAEGPDDPCR